ncbi:methylated-DNA--[protein]-cysteine S-methyltransferase [Dysgonomonas sp. Marseille-P4677]|uniref:methylated-DNA--[protein]-cysteine S-methyltransferase n=1 Tax=Dysgonomonas sp. Marseille-P4677 TaxID=2364790 RepID=UPI001914B702|nr:methylated-DNA--[protein]-cysteine S-methyltransferase [Dysgonomonas sp. Marseille-P4677]MBK5721567.1 methylated-DNA--[protein]-cysteine S-methyltransferase [Dysgonomonas sp. Marseille-P4677]
MNKQKIIDFIRIKDAIEYINGNYKSQPDLDEVASYVALSPFHFQRMFTRWAGVSPKKFLQYISVENAKKMLKETQASLFDTAFEVGLSGTGRLHDLFVNIEGMTPGEYKNGGLNLAINYSFAETPFGEILIASTSKGICYMAFVEDEVSALQEMKHVFPNAEYKQLTDSIQQNALYIFTQDWQKPEQIQLHVAGSNFQLKVWEILLKIPRGGLATYRDVAERIGSPGASRAVGTAIAENPVAYLIPCHRVILSSGKIGQYHWESARKSAIIGWEMASLK